MIWDIPPAVGGSSIIVSVQNEENATLHYHAIVRDASVWRLVTLRDSNVTWDIWMIWIIFKLILVIDDRGIFMILPADLDIALRPDFVGDKSTVVQVRAWSRQATNQYLSQCWPKSTGMSSYGVISPQWVNPKSFFVGLIQLSRPKHQRENENSWSLHFVMRNTELSDYLHVVSVNDASDTKKGQARANGNPGFLNRFLTTSYLWYN